MRMGMGMRWDRGGLTVATRRGFTNTYVNTLTRNWRDTDIPPALQTPNVSITKGPSYSINLCMELIAWSSIWKCNEATSNVFPWTRTTPVIIGFHQPLFIKVKYELIYRMVWIFFSGILNPLQNHAAYRIHTDHVLEEQNENPRSTENGRHCSFISRLCGNKSPSPCMRHS